MLVLLQPALFFKMYNSPEWEYTGLRWTEPSVDVMGIHWTEMDRAIC